MPLIRQIVLGLHRTRYLSGRSALPFGSGGGSGETGDRHRRRSCLRRRGWCAHWSFSAGRSDSPTSSATASPSAALLIEQTAERALFRSSRQRTTLRPSAPGFSEQTTVVSERHGRGPTRSGLSVGMRMSCEGGRSSPGRPRVVQHALNIRQSARPSDCNPRTVLTQSHETQSGCAKGRV
jgi:hypothetical protein